eukprot:CAMPEP_0196659118 /NCGR_PEP_ID=MMETSP1086-20130531/33187_1 /TAXON_ID=77921 /ORGANISM="Cyanoptyche  gloeocystis , Strain SAG4.97" /LENGTH=268 /DNA_ID=CAMNT_0041992969 /DNA_START=52 /DNA_END=858 /DNA_ORIENTATION=-
MGRSLDISLQVLNFVTFVGAVVVGYYTPSASISDKYHLIVTPTGRTFLIWILIYLLESAFCIYACIPFKPRKELVFDGVAWLFVLVNIAQALWAVAFKYEYLWLSAAILLFDWIFLLLIVVRLFTAPYVSIRRSYWDYWLIYFTFCLHFAWVSIAAPLNIFISLYGDLGLSLFSDSVIAGIVIEVCLSAYFVAAMVPTTEPIIGAVWIWALVGIAIENPGLGSISIALAAIMTAVTLIFLILRIRKWYHGTKEGTEDKSKLLSAGPSV